MSKFPNWSHYSERGHPLKTCEVVTRAKMRPTDFTGTVGSNSSDKKHANPVKMFTKIDQDNIQTEDVFASRKRSASEAFNKLNCHQQGYEPMHAPTLQSGISGFGGAAKKQHFKFGHVTNGSSKNRMIYGSSAQPIKPDSYQAIALRTRLRLQKNSQVPNPASFLYGQNDFSVGYSSNGGRRDKNWIETTEAEKRRKQLEMLDTDQFLKEHIVKKQEQQCEEKEEKRRDFDLLQSYEPPWGQGRPTEHVTQQLVQERTELERQAQRTRADRNLRGGGNRSSAEMISSLQPFGRPGNGAPLVDAGGRVKAGRMWGGVHAKDSFSLNLRGNHDSTHAGILAHKSTSAPSASKHNGSKKAAGDAASMLAAGYASKPASSGPSFMRRPHKPLFEPQRNIQPAYKGIITRQDISSVPAQPITRHGTTDMQAHSKRMDFLNATTFNDDASGVIDHASKRRVPPEYMPADNHIFDGEAGRADSGEHSKRRPVDPDARSLFATTMNDDAPVVYKARRHFEQGRTAMADAIREDINDIARKAGSIQQALGISFNGGDTSAGVNSDADN